jgi:hypothetical protein
LTRFRHREERLRRSDPSGREVDRKDAAEQVVTFDRRRKRVGDLVSTIMF